MVSELTHPPLVRTLLLVLASVVLVVASLGIDQTAHNRSEARDLGFGYPVHFAVADFTNHSGPPPPGYPQTYKLNPWEVPVEGSAFALLASCLLVYAALLGCWLLARNIFGRARRLAVPRSSESRF